MPGVMIMTDRMRSACRRFATCSAAFNSIGSISWIGTTSGGGSRATRDMTSVNPVPTSDGIESGDASTGTRIRRA
jgi:hypothetical protein